MGYARVRRMERKLSKKHIDWHPRKIKLVATDDKMTQAAGLGSMVEVFDQSSLSKGFAECLPQRTSNRSSGSYRLGLIQVGSFLYGHDCIDDIQEFREDPLFEAALKGEVSAPRTILDFLHDFDHNHIDKFNNYLAKMSWAIRRQLMAVQPEKHKPKVPHFSIDSTPHEQEGLKMEGVEFNYDGKWCLDSQEIYDELGFSYGFQLRPGATKSGVDADQLIEQALKLMKFTDEKIVSGDAAYCWQDPIRTCVRLGAKFTFTANQATTGWQNQIGEIHEWEPWVYSEEEIVKAAASNKTLPKIELGFCLWQPGWAQGNLKFPIVVKRTWTPNSEPSLFNQADEGKWDHYGVATNFCMYKNTKQFVIETHNKRGNCENFIKEDKYGLDLLHYPCQKLLANTAFGMIAQVAHNILRWVALIQKPDKPHFSKKLRRRFIYIPGRLVSHARQLVLKIPIRFHEGVTHLVEALTSKPCPSLDTC